MAKKKQPTSREKTKSFESSMEQLESIVRELEAGNFGLSDSLQKYEEGVKHLKQCYQLLEQAEKRVQLLTGINKEGEAVTQDFDDQATTMDSSQQGKSSAASSSQSAAGNRNRPASPANEAGSDDVGPEDALKGDVDDGPTLF